MVVDLWPEVHLVVASYVLEWDDSLGFGDKTGRGSEGSVRAQASTPVGVWEAEKKSVLVQGHRMYGYLSKELEPRGSGGRGCPSRLCYKSYGSTVWVESPTLEINGLGLVHHGTFHSHHLI